MLNTYVDIMLIPGSTLTPGSTYGPVRVYFQYQGGRIKAFIVRAKAERLQYQTGGKSVLFPPSSPMAYLHHSYLLPPIPPSPTPPSPAPPLPVPPSSILHPVSSILCLALSLLRCTDVHMWPPDETPVLRALCFSLHHFFSRGICSALLAFVLSHVSLGRCSPSSS